MQGVTMALLLFMCFCLISSVATEEVIVRGTRATSSSLKKTLSDLHFQLFTSIQKQNRMIKTAVFETQCTGRGCTFNGCDSGEGNTCHGQMMSKLQQIQNSIGKLNKPGNSETVCKSGWKKYGKHCYIEMKQKLNWFNAQMFCRNHGASLVRIDSAGENNWLKKQYRTVPLWIDFTDLGKEGRWKWFSNGRTASYTHWKKGEPNNDSSIEDCAVTNHGGRIGIWNDVPCALKFRFICEA